MWRGAKGRSEKPHQCFVERPEAEAIDASREAYLKTHTHTHTHNFFYSSIVDLQYCVNFCCTESDSVIPIQTFFFIMPYHRIWKRVPCAIQ